MSHLVSSPLRPRLRSESGQSLVEFALLAPILVLLIFASVYLSDLVTARLRTHEVVRYAAFAMAKQPLTDYWAPAGGSTAGAQTTMFNAAQARVKTETEKIYAHLDSMFDVPVHQVSLIGTLTSVNITAQPLPVLPSASLSELGTALGGGIVTETVIQLIGGLINSLIQGQVDKLGYNGKAVVRVQAMSAWANVFLPQVLQRYVGHTQLAAFPLTDTVILAADPWGLGDGGDVRTPGYINRDPGQPKNEAALHNQVQRMYFLNGAMPGVVQFWLTAFQEVTAVISGAGVGFGPLDAKVASFNYTDQASTPAADKCDGTTGQSLGCQDVFKVNGASNGAGIRNFETTQMRDRFNGTSPNVQAYQLRGNHYMGCKKSEQHDCTFQ